MTMLQFVGAYFISFVTGLGALVMIKRGLAGPYKKELNYTAADVLTGCILLFALFLMWFK